MAITETIQAKEFTAGAPNITLQGDLRPNQMMASMDENEREFMRLIEEFMERGFNQQEAIDAAREELDKKAMAYGGRAQYGLGSFVKSIGKAVKGVVKGVTGAVKKNPLLAAAALNFAPMLLKGGAPLIGFGKTAGTLGTVFKDGLPTLASLGTGKEGFLKTFAIGSLGGTLLAAAEAGGLDTSDPNAEVDIESIKGYLSRGYKNLNPEATDEEVFQFVQENTAEYRAMGGRIGYENGMLVEDKPKIFKVTSDRKIPSFEEYMRERKGIEQKMNMEQLYKEYLEDMRRKKVAEQKTMAAEGGRIGYAIGTDEKVDMAAGIEGLPVRQNKAGVKELDLRETGGFIQPVGIKEKADDIPAMLSNNEFVFTADAVRAAGGGDIDKGAQLMYDTMKKLESKVV